jgi:hypothetical protein
LKTTTKSPDLGVIILNYIYYTLLKIISMMIQNVLLNIFLYFEILQFENNVIT